MTVVVKTGGNLSGFLTEKTRHLLVLHFFRERIRQVKIYLMTVDMWKREKHFILFCRSI